MSGKINFIVQSMWGLFGVDTRGDKNVYQVEEFYYEGGKIKGLFRFIKIGKQKGQEIKGKKLRNSDICILSIPEEQIEAEQWTQHGKTYNALSFGNDVVVDKLTEENSKIFFIYDSCGYPFGNEFTFEGIGGIKRMEEEWVFPVFEKITISFSNHEEAQNKWREFNGKKSCAVEGIDWERAIMYPKELKIKVFSKIGETFTAPGEAMPLLEEPETITETHTTETEETRDTPADTTSQEPETTGTPEQNTGTSHEPISVYDYFETKLADEDQNLWTLVNQYIPGHSKDEKKMFFLSLIKSGVINEGHVDSQRKFIKYGFLKSKLEEIYPQNQGSQNGSPPSGNGLSQTRKNAIQTITAALNLEPAVKESELSSEFHGWNEKINNLNKDEIINDFCEQMLLVIGIKRREKQTSQRVNDNLNDMKNKTGEELNEKIKENDEASDTKTYEENKEEIETQKKRSALEDSDKYLRNVAIPAIKGSMARNDIKEDELDDDTRKDWEKLKNGEVQGEEIVEKETKIKQLIGQQGAKKKVNFFRNEVEAALKSGKKERIEKLKKLMIEFINSDNIYYQVQKTEVQSLLSRLSDHSNKKHNSNSPKPWKVVVPVSLLAVILILTALAVIRKRKRISQIKKKKTKSTN